MIRTHFDVVADAPGRVNLIGEHTDYHEGYVMPAVIPQRTRVHLRRRNDDRVCARSTAFGEHAGEYEIGREAGGRGWLDYVQGVTASLRRLDIRLTGLDLQVESTIPVGAGVSSSAALLVALLRGLRTLFSLELDDLTLARIAHTAETEFVGAPVGIMDQIACSVGRDGEALFIDTRSLRIDRLPLPPSLDLVVIHSGVVHAHAGGEYVARRRESFEGARLLGVERLRDVSAAEMERTPDLPAVLARRVRHVVTENARVLAAVEALRAGDGPRLGQLFSASHASMRDDYEISIPEIDTLVSIAEGHPGIFGARLTGGGFGGAVVALARGGTAGEAARAIRDAYVRQTGRPAVALLPIDVEGA